MPREWRTIKVPAEAYEELKKMGVGIGRAVEVLVESQRTAIERKIEDVEKVGREVADVLFKSGFFNISFGGAGITRVEEDGDEVRVHGYFSIVIPDAEVRGRIMQVLKGEES